MIRVENVEVFNFEGAIRGMRNPMNSWDKSDSEFDIQYYDDEGNEGTYYAVELGANDLDLMRRLYKAGTEHRKYLRQIFVSMDITAPLYWWKEFDTYKFVLPDSGHVDTNSCSTMHKIHSKEFELDDFSHEHLLYTGEGDNPIDMIMHWLNYYRKRYLETKDKKFWWVMIQLLPSSYNQKRTITMNYENAVSIIKQRLGHKLDEWRDFVVVLIEQLPYLNEIMEEVEEH